jgi:hypothetical protein
LQRRQDRPLQISGALFAGFLRALGGGRRVGLAFCLYQP